MNRKVGIILALGIILVLWSGFALADGPTDPDRAQMKAFKKQEQEFRRQQNAPEPEEEDKKVLYSASGYVDRIEIIGNLRPGQTLDFAAYIKYPYDPNQLVYRWGITDVKRDSGGYIYYPQHGDLTGRGSISYCFHSGGTYSVFVSAYLNGSRIGSAYEEFTIPDDATHDTLEERAAKIVNQCRGSTQWETAVNLYEWLTHHAYYDKSLDYHGADILFLEYGVCDSYSKAYMLLCKTAGISAERATSSSHAWNTIYLGGKWYQADPTWDDPGSWYPGEGSIVSGNEGFMFFGLSSEIMQHIRAHGLESGEHARSCTSLDMNYYIHTNKWRDWGERTYNYSAGAYQATPYIQIIADSFNEGAVFWEKTLDWICYMENGATKYLYCQEDQEGIAQGILAYALNNNPGIIQLTPGGKIRISASVIDSYKGICATVEGWDLVETGTLIIPAGTTDIEQEAFAGTAATTVDLGNCKKVLAGAFRDSAVRTVYVPETVTYIAYDAFDNDKRIIFVTDNSVAKTHAEEHGFIVIPPNN